MKHIAVFVALFAYTSVSRSAEVQVRTATSHAMKYLVSLPKNWTANRTWPVLVAPSAHYDAGGKSLAQFATERDARKSDFIIVAPFVINADPVKNMPEYRGVVANSINAADAEAGEYGRDEVARAKFDSEGVCAVIKDIQQLYGGEDKVWIAGFSSSTHIAYMFVFAHPELLKGAVINSGVYLGRGVNEEHIPLLNSPGRAGMAVKFIIGENDPGYATCTENWAKAKTRLLSYGHIPARLETEIIRKGNADNLGRGHQWFIPRILDFCSTGKE